MNEERTGKCLRQVEHIRGHLWHRYSITVNQVILYLFLLQEWNLTPIQIEKHIIYLSFAGETVYIVVTMEYAKMKKVFLHSYLFILQQIISSMSSFQSSTADFVNVQGLIHHKEDLIYKFCYRWISSQWNTITVIVLLYKLYTFCM